MDQQPDRLLDHQLAVRRTTVDYLRPGTINRTTGSDENTAVTSHPAEVGTPALLRLVEFRLGL